MMTSLPYMFASEALFCMVDTALAMATAAAANENGAAIVRIRDVFGVCWVLS